MKHIGQWKTLANIKYSVLYARYIEDVLESEGTYAEMRKVFFFCIKSFIIFSATFMKTILNIEVKGCFFIGRWWRAGSGRKCSKGWNIFCVFAFLKCYTLYKYKSTLINVFMLQFQYSTTGEPEDRGWDWDGSKWSGLGHL